MLQNKVLHFPGEKKNSKLKNTYCNIFFLFIESKYYKGFFDKFWYYFVQIMVLVEKHIFRHHHTLIGWASWFYCLLIPSSRGFSPPHLSRCKRISWNVLKNKSLKSLKKWYLVRTEKNSLKCLSMCFTC